MNTHAKFAAAALLAGLIAIPAPAHAQSATAAASVQVVAPLSVESVAELEFGTLRGGASAGVVEIEATGQVRARGGVELIEGPSRHPARFEVSGEPNRAYRMNMPHSVLVAPQGAANDPTQRRPVELTSVSSGDAQSGRNGRLDAAGGDVIFVGGRIDIPAHMQAGRYVVDLPLTLAYD